MARAKIDVVLQLSRAGVRLAAVLNKALVGRWRRHYTVGRGAISSARRCENLLLALQKSSVHGAQEVSARPVAWIRVHTENVCREQLANAMPRATG